MAQYKCSIIIIIIISMCNQVKFQKNRITTPPTALGTKCCELIHSTCCIHCVARKLISFVPSCFDPRYGKEIRCCTFDHALPSFAENSSNTGHHNFHLRTIVSDWSETLYLDSFPTLDIQLMIIEATG